MIPKIGNKNCNNTISINVFLNLCKNAMNLTDFIEQLQVSLEDSIILEIMGLSRSYKYIYKNN